MKRILAASIVLALITVLLCGCTKSDAPHLGDVVILGDSFSTFAGYIPEGYKSWYSPEVDYAGVKSVEDTWWHNLISDTKSNLLLNSSYSGSTVCNTGYDGKDSSDFSFATRITELIEAGFFEENSVDTLIIYGGLNDCWAQSPRGELKYDDITDSDLYSFYPALSFILKSVREHSPETRIIMIIEEQLDSGMKDGIRQIAAHYNVETVEPHGIELHGSHPGKKGMRAISDQIIAALSE